MFSIGFIGGAEGFTAISKIAASVGLHLLWLDTEGKPVVVPNRLALTCVRTNELDLVRRLNTLLHSSEEDVLVIQESNKITLRDIVQIQTCVQDMPRYSTLYPRRGCNGVEKTRSNPLFPSLWSKRAVEATGFPSPGADLSQVSYEWHTRAFAKGFLAYQVPGSLDAPKEVIPVVRGSRTTLPCKISVTVFAPTPNVSSDSLESLFCKRCLQATVELWNQQSIPCDVTIALVGEDFWDLSEVLGDRNRVLHRPPWFGPNTLEARLACLLMSLNSGSREAAVFTTLDAFPVDRYLAASVLSDLQNHPSVGYITEKDPYWSMLLGIKDPQKVLRGLSMEILNETPKNILREAKENGNLWSLIQKAVPRVESPYMSVIPGAKFEDTRIDYQGGVARGIDPQHRWKSSTLREVEHSLLRAEQRVIEWRTSDG